MSSTFMHFWFKCRWTYVNLFVNLRQSTNGLPNVVPKLGAIDILS